MIERSNKGLHDFVYNYLDKNENKYTFDNILDIASGSGAWLARFKNISDTNKLGLDLDIKQFQLKDVKAIPFNFDNYTNEQFGQFELITCLELIEHLENPGKLIQLIKNNLSTSGVCVMSTPNIHSIQARLRFLLKGRLGHFDDKSDPTHIYPVYIENLQRLLFNHHLSLEQTVIYPFCDNYGTGIKFLSALLKPFIPQSFFGDNIIFVIKHNV
ncbi:MAG: methyltransferase domain-containing protein [Sphingobacteriia bacterium]|jgi:2-polyprenyl-3-methyl-5-hydroxy-6-metoxy-1,4-benzoquinol methylase